MKYKYLAPILILIFLSTSCVSKKKLPETCANLYPPMDSVTVVFSSELDTLITSSTMILHDTTICAPDSVTVISTKQIEVEVPKHVVITKTINKDSIIYKSNTAKELHLTNELQKLQGKYDEQSKNTKSSNKKSKNRLWIIIALCLLILTVGGFKVYRFIKGVATSMLILLSVTSCINQGSDKKPTFVGTWNINTNGNEINLWDSGYGTLEISAYDSDAGWGEDKVIKSKIPITWVYNEEDSIATIQYDDIHIPESDLFVCRWKVKQYRYLRIYATDQLTNCNFSLHRIQ